MSKETDNKNVHEGHRKRVRERFLKNGLKDFEDYQILEFLLFYVYKRKDTNEIAHELLNEFGSLENVFGATCDEMRSVKGIGESAAILVSLIGQMQNRINNKCLEPGVFLTTDEITGNYCVDYMKNLKHERLILISMNSEKKVLGVDVISEGDHGATSVDVRKIVTSALKRKATAVVIAHNHPGDSVHPSDSDIVITGRIVSVLEGMDIAVTDHIICNDTTYTSMASRGILDRNYYVRSRI